MSERFVLVGDWPTPVSEAEWVVATMRPGTPVEFETKDQRPFGSPSRHGTGLFKFSTFYDGVVGTVELLGGESLAIFPALGDSCRPLADRTVLAAAGCGGEGI